MPATGLRGIVGYFSCLLGMKSESFKNYFTKKFNYGFIVGNFLPDYDGPLSLFIWLASGDLSYIPCHNRRGVPSYFNP
ncbi:MAG: hypothetical protein ACTSR0_06470 [Candidatus Asgardarchaeia archaeon]